MVRKTIHSPFLPRSSLRSSSRGMKRPLLIAKHQVTLPKQHDHLRIMIVPRIDKLQRHRYQISIVPIQLWPEVDPCMGRITSWKLKNLNATMQIERKKVALSLPRRFMAHKSI